MDEDENILTGEMIELPDDEDDSVIDTEDGGAIVRLDDGEGDARSDDFYANLAETMSESELSEIARTYLDVVGKDKQARKKRDEQYEEGLRRTGLGDDAPGGAQTVLVVAALVAALDLHVGLLSQAEVRLHADRR